MHGRDLNDNFELYVDPLPSSSGRKSLSSVDDTCDSMIDVHLLEFVK